MTLVSNAHYAAADPNCKILEYCRLDNELRENFLPDGFEQDGDHVQLPDTDGLGLNLSDDIDERSRTSQGLVTSRLESERSRWRDDPDPVLT